MSRPHMRLMPVSEAYGKIEHLNCSKLQNLIFESPKSLEYKIIMTSLDSNGFQKYCNEFDNATEEQENGNIEATLDHILTSGPLKENELLLVCGSFFIMTDVRQYFGYEDETDRIL